MSNNRKVDEIGGGIYSSDYYHSDFRNKMSAPRSGVARVLFITVVALVTLLFALLVGLFGAAVLFDNQATLAGLYQWLPRAGLVILAGLCAILVLRP